MSLFELVDRAEHCFYIFLTDITLLDLNLRGSARNFLRQASLFLVKSRMRKFNLLVRLPYLSKAVYIQLPEKTCHVRMLEIMREDALSKLILIFDEKALLLIRPRYYLRISFIVQDLVKFVKKNYMLLFFHLFSNICTYLQFLSQPTEE